MEIQVLAKFTVTKAGQSPEENEDQGGIRDDLTAAAVSDGASEASHSRLWARCLVDRYLDTPTTLVNSEWLLPAIQRLSSHLDYDRLPWHTLLKLSRGTFATLTGISFDRERNEFSAVAVGDSCLAWHGATESGLLSAPGGVEATARPYLLSHLLEANRELDTHQEARERIPLTEGETYFFLMTDALANWYRCEEKREMCPWSELLSLREEPDFAEWVEAHRGEGSMGNDDVTLIVLQTRVSGLTDADASSISL